jgi:hypothetical protein
MSNYMTTTPDTQTLEDEVERLRLVAATYRDRICEGNDCLECPLSGGECLALEDETAALDVPDIARILAFAEKLVGGFVNTGRCFADCPWRRDVCEDIVPDTDDHWCELANKARRLGIKISLPRRKHEPDTRTSVEIRRENRRLARVVRSQSNFFSCLERQAHEQLDLLAKDAREAKADTDRTRQVLRDFAAEILPVATCVDDHEVEDAIEQFAEMI